MIALVADGRELPRAGLAAMLQRDLGFEVVVEASNLNEALSHLKRIKVITLAVFDSGLPGLEIIGQLQEIRSALPNLSVVVVSDTPRRNDILQSLAAGVHGFILKTMPITEIIKAFRLVLDGHIYVPSCLADVLHVVPPDPSSGIVQDARPARALLTHRQQDVLDLIGAGKSNKQIARALHLAEGTIKVHVNNLYRVLGVHSRVGAVTAMLVARNTKDSTSPS